MSARARIIGVLRRPAVHFIVLGALAFGGERLFAKWTERAAIADTGIGVIDRSEVVITAAQIRELEKDFVKEAGMPPTKEQRAALITQAVDDELLYREARALGLDRNDKSVRARLIDKMRAVSDDPSLDDEQLLRAALAAGLDDDLVIKRILRENLRIMLRADPERRPPSDDELAAYLAAHRDEYLAPETVSFEHVFLSAREHGDNLERDASAVRAQLVARRVAPHSATSYSDPFPLGFSFPARPHGALARQFGAPFADAIREQAGGKWSRPIASPYGLHLVWVRDRTAAAVPPLSALRQRLAVAVVEDRAATRLRDGLARLRTLYPVRIEGETP